MPVGSRGAVGGERAGARKDEVYPSYPIILLANSFAETWVGSGAKTETGRLFFLSYIIFSALFEF